MIQTDITEHLPSGFAPQSKVWIYQASRMFLIGEALQLEPMLQDFISNWNSHGEPVKGFANLFFGQFLIFIADETDTQVGGCSTDNSVQLVKQIQQKFSVEMLNRQLLAFIIKNKIETLPLAQLDYALSNQFITEDTPYFNNTVLTLEELKSRWIVPVKESWLAAKLK